MGARWDHRAPEGSPGGVAGLQLVLCLSSPDAWASLPTWCPEGVQAFLSWKRPQQACQQGVGGPSGVQRGWRFLHSGHPSPPSRSLRSFAGLFMTRAGVARGWGQDRAGMAALGVCAHTEPLLQPLEGVLGATVCPLVTSEGLRLLEESILLPSCDQGHVSSPSHVPRGLGLPGGGAVSNV